MDYAINTITDSYYCETCGSSYAEGFEIYCNGELIHTMKPVAHCYSGQGYDMEDVLEWILNELGHTVNLG